MDMAHRTTSSSSTLGVKQGLQGQLNSRQIAMISIGGAIGAGLFVGSSNAIATAGPAALIAYIVATGLVIIIMKMLGEMATAQPATGSFSSYADVALGRWAGFSIGWLYWWFYMLVVAIESIVAGNIIATWIGGPSWLYAIGAIAALTGCNCVSARTFGEAEYWLSLVKVVAIIGFILLGLAAIIGVLPTVERQGVHNLFDYGGFFPQGGFAVLAAFFIAIFSFQGCEIVTIAAAESDYPRRNIRKAIKAVLWRLGIFYIGSIFVATCTVPWNDPSLPSGTYQAALLHMHIPYASEIMSLIVLTAVVSCLNSSIYTASRMTYSLADRGDAPRSWSTTSASGAPRVAVCCTSLCSFLVTVINYTLPATFFNTLLATSGAVALLVYLVIAITQLRLRQLKERQGIQLEVKMWLFPYLSIFTIAAIIAAFAGMLLIPEHRIEVGATLMLAAAIIAVGTYLQITQKNLSAKRSSMSSMRLHDVSRETRPC